MPKVIPELRERIIECAEKLLSDNAYTDMDMRKIASMCGIAVGTLYNYFSNKEEIFVNIFKKSWQKTLVDLKNAVNSTNTADEKLKSFFKILYKDIKFRKGIGKEIFAQSGIFKEKIKPALFRVVVQRVTNQLKDMLLKLIYNKAAEKDILISKDDAERLAITALFSVYGSIKFFPNEYEKNIEYILSIISLYIEGVGKKDESNI